MPLARFKDLCMDTGPSEVLGRFWASALGLRFEPDGEAGSLVGVEPAQRVWINVVAEPKTVKHRVHLDVHCASRDELVALGATVLEPIEDHPGRHWSVLADPEGGEFCAFVRAASELRDYRLYEVVVDAAAPRTVAAWWADVFGATLGGREDEGWWWLDDVPGLPFDGWSFVPVPEPKTVKNRIHWDVTTDSVADLVSVGAKILQPPTDECRWHVLADPEGNEFCAFASTPE
ncbi:MAG TPA: VOC family protein [Nocardioidaceae bacterium]|nr:VOC family protein [Nocardioidaceae bacterium]